MVTQVAIQQKEDIGFYARVPRIVRIGYKELSHAEKWLYTCLRDLCGEVGECWRSLRTLAEETGISIASLCKMIPHLAKVGLIEAVMKGTWFIKIVNIWKDNREYCSKNEHSATGVQNLNTLDASIALPVQKMNATCSENEQGCSNFSNKEDISKKIESEEDRRDSSLTDVSDRAYEKGYPDQTAKEQSVRDQYARITAMDDAFLAEMEAKLYTCSPHHVEKATAPPQQPSTTEAALQADAHQFTEPGKMVGTTTPASLFPATSPVSQQEAARGASTKETRKPRENKKVDETPALSDTKEVHRRINDRRGYALEESVEIIRENKAIKTWCHLHKIEELDPVLDYLQERDQYWSKPENKYRIGGVTLLKETPRVLAQLTKRKQQPSIPIFVPPPTIEQLRAMPL